MRDTLGREITYLRISLTDRCNLRCVYCMPPEGVNKREHREILSLEEMEEIARAAAALGVRKIRLTGGSRWCGGGCCPSAVGCGTSPSWRS